jgi:hypothetical protein
MPKAHPGFLVDRLAERWDHGQPIRDSDDVSRLIARFSPDEVPAEVWARVEGPVREWVQRAEPKTLERARNLLNAVTQLAIWGDTLGLPLEPEVLLRPETIDRFVVEGCRDLTDGTRTNYRTALRAVGRKVLSPDLFPPQPIALPRSPKEPPYSQSEIAALVSWTSGLPTERMRGNARALIAFGLGAGCTTQELARVIGTDVASDGEGVLVALTGQATRTVPVLRRWENEVLSRSVQVGERPVFLPDRTRIVRHHIPNFIWRCQRALPGRISAFSDSGSPGSSASSDRARPSKISRPTPASSPNSSVATSISSIPATLPWPVGFSATQAAHDRRRRRGANRA